MEQVFKLEQPNQDLIVPFDALPPIKAFTPTIFCKNLDHRDQLVQYLILRPSNDILQTRLACIKCIQGPLSVCSQDVALLEDVAADRFNLLKFTKYQQNEYQKFSDLLHAFDFTFDKSMIELKFNKIQEQLIYELNRCKEGILSQYENYLKCKQEFENIKKSLNNTFDFTNVAQKLDEFSRLGKNPQPKKWRDLNEILDVYVSKFHKKDTPEYQNLIKDLEQLKKTLSTQKQLFLHKNKIEQGVQNILDAIKEMRNTFSTKLFIQSELSDDYMQDVLERIDVKYKAFDEVDKIKRIYSSINEGLDYRKICQTLPNYKQSQLLFVFKTNADLRFGAFVASQQKNNLLFSLSKRQIYPIKGGLPQQSPAPQGPIQTTSPQGPAQTPPVPQGPGFTNNNNRLGLNGTFLPGSQPLPGTLNFPPGGGNASRITPTVTVPPTQTVLSPPEQSNGSAYYIDYKVDDNGVLFKFGGQDLVVMSNFSNCTSNLGVGYNISEYSIGNTEMHLANAKNFQIVGLEIFILP